MMNYCIRLRAVHHRRLAALLQTAMPAESVAFLLCRRVEGAERVIYLCDDVLEVQNDEYVRRSHDIASVSPAAMARIARVARERHRVIAMAHIHPMTQTGVDFSDADDLGNERSFRFFHQRVPQEEHLALVWNGTTTECAGLIYGRDGKRSKIASIVVPDLEEWVEYVRQDEHPQRGFDRQAMLLGQAGQAHVRRFRFIVAGAGGIGSLVSMGLVHHGVRRYGIIDDEVLDDTNPPRIVASRPSDIGHQYKVDIARQYAHYHAPDVNIDTFRVHVEHPRVLPHLIAADAIIVGTDNTTSRAFLTEISHKYLVPLLDLGVQFTIDLEGNVVNEIGRINLMRPGTACGWCTGHLDAARLVAESVPRPERQRKGSYLRGFDDPQPSMLAFNMEVVGRGLQVLIGYVTGLLSQPLHIFEQRTFLRMKGNSLARQVRKTQRADCPICGPDGVVATADMTSSSITRRAM